MRPLPELSHRLVHDGAPGFIIDKPAVLAYPHLAEPTVWLKGIAMFSTLALLIAIAAGNFTPAQRAWINGLTPDRVTWLMGMDEAYNAPRARPRDEIVVMAMTLTSGVDHGRPRDFLDNPEIASGQTISMWFEARTLREFEAPPNVSVSWYHEDGPTPLPGCTSLHVFGRDEDPIRDFSTCRPDMPGNWRVVVVYGMRLLDYRTFRVRRIP